jgi:hypothetical protein
MGHFDKILLCAMGHYGKFGNTPWATSADLVMRYGLLQEIRPYIKNLYNFHAMGHSTGFGYALWAIAQYLVIHYWP